MKNGSVSIKIKNDFIVKGTREEKNLQAWFENQVGVRKAKIHTEKGFENYVVSFTELKKFKTLKQNKTFWSLIDCFWQSSCSSFYTYDEMKEYYYRIAGLIEVKTKNILKEETRRMLFEAIKVLPLEFTEKQRVWQFLKGEYERHLSWSIVKKSKAILAIDSLLKHMDESNVIGSKMGKKYEEILIGMEKI